MTNSHISNFLFNTNKHKTHNKGNVGTLARAQKGFDDFHLWNNSVDEIW